MSEKLIIIILVIILVITISNTKLNEANYDILKDKGFKGYNIEYNTLHINSVISRTILLVKKGINFKRRYDIENIGISSIWVQAQISKKVSIMVCSYYRQWSLPSCFNIENSNSLYNQNNRYSIFSSQIKKVHDEGKDFLILTDENINMLDEISSSCYSKNT